MQAHAWYNEYTSCTAEFKQGVLYSRFTWVPKHHCCFDSTLQQTTIHACQSPALATILPRREVSTVPHGVRPKQCLDSNESHAHSTLLPMPLHSANDLYSMVHGNGIKSHSHAAGAILIRVPRRTHACNERHACMGIKRNECLQ